jgi:hypothetical protein
VTTPDSGAKSPREAVARGAAEAYAELAEVAAAPELPDRARAHGPMRASSAAGGPRPATTTTYGCGARPARLGTGLGAGSSARARALLSRMRARARATATTRLAYSGCFRSSVTPYHQDGAGLRGQRLPASDIPAEIGPLCPFCRVQTAGWHRAGQRRQAGSSPPCRTVPLRTA